MQNHQDSNSILKKYLNKEKLQDINYGAVAFYASLDQIATVSPNVAKSIINEFNDQRRNLKLIASENFSSLATQFAQSNLLTDKYAEGYPKHRFYAGCDNVDDIETLAIELACKLFNADHAYVQPHSGADANIVAFISILSAKIQKPLLEKIGNDDPTQIERKDWELIRKEVHNQRLLALDLYSGGHLTHGYRRNFSSQMFDVFYYSVDPKTYMIDYDAIREQLHNIKPLIFLAGYSAYSRKINFAKLRELCDEVGSVLMVDMAHFAGLVAGKVFVNDFDPVPFADIVATTTHKTLRGPRGGLILCKKELAEWVDKGCPSILGGPLAHVLAAKAIAFKEALTDEFKNYAHKIVANATTLAESFNEEGMGVLTGGTDNHLVLLDVYKTFGLTGRQAESALRECSITLNRNTIPFDSNGPWYTSGLRLGTPALTTLGMGTDEMKLISKMVKQVLVNAKPGIATNGIQSKSKYNIDENTRSQVSGSVKDLLDKFPLYPEYDIDILMEFADTL